MKRSLFPSFRLFSFWLALGALVLGISADTAVAQRDPNPPLPILPGQPETPPRMEFQPPVDADDLSDFIPPDAVAIEISDTPFNWYTSSTRNDSSPSTTVQIDGAKTNAVSFQQGKIAVVIEADTLAPQSSLQFAALSLPVSATITQTNTISNPVETQFLARFQLEAIQDGVVDSQFDKPVRLIADVRSLTAGLNPVYSGYFIAYWDESNNTWHDVTSTIHQSDGLLSAETTHFSEWVIGVRPNRWNPNWTPPSVANFSGAATYSYPINVPPGRHGLQPSVTLSYNSRGLDGRIHDKEPGAIADGWSLGQISVVRDGVKVHIGFNNHPELHHPDKFRLVLNGVGHELVHDGNTQSNVLRYYAKDAPDVKVYRYYEATAPNTDGLFWIVTTGDGAQYRLGYFDNAEEYQEVRGSSGGLELFGGHSGRPNGKISAIAWHVDTVTDVYGNQITHHYYTNYRSFA